MTLDEALNAAGFPGVERDGEQVFGRIAAAESEFTGREVSGLWELVLTRPMRASEAQLRDWAARHPDAPLEIFAGETRLVLRLPADDMAGLARWSALAEAAVIACTRWRKGQRDRGEGW